MKLYLVRHGTAGDASRDELRPLTAEGKEELVKVTKCLERLSYDGAEIWHSGLLRARESAEIIAQGLGLQRSMHVHPELAPDEPPLPVAGAVLGRKGDLFLVGHQPFMGKMVSCLMTGRPDAQFVDFNKGAVACFRPPAIAGRSWKLAWMLDPALLA